MKAFETATIDLKLNHVLQENERLRARLGAVRHSLGNHLALMSAMLARQARGCEQGVARDALGAAQSRIAAIAEALRASMIDPDLEEVAVREPIARLIDEFRAHAADLQIEISAQIGPSAIRADDAVSLLLVVNELASNALKHAFPGDIPGRVQILFGWGREGLKLVVEDDGVGRREGAEPRLGGKIVLGAVRTLGASLDEAPVLPGRARPGHRVTVSKAPVLS